MLERATFNSKNFKKRIIMGLGFVLAIIASLSKNRASESKTFK